MSDKFLDKLADVQGRSPAGNSIYFTLTRQEVKHIRRCLSMYDRVFDRIYFDHDGKKKESDSLSKSIYAKFSQFGKLSRAISTQQKRAKINHLDKKCSFEGCEERDNLTIDHIKPLGGTINANNKDNLRLLCPKHHLLKELKAMLYHKGLDMEKLKLRIEGIEKAATTDCLGYQVPHKNKFESIDSE